MPEQQQLDLGKPRIHGFLCTRRRSSPPCGCGKTSTKLCDYPVTRFGRLTTCDKPLCDDCAFPMDSKRDYCGPHHRHVERLRACGRSAPSKRELEETALTRAPLARNTDPESSHEAADLLRESGELTRQEQLVADLVHRFPGRTGRELAAESGTDYHLIMRRVRDLERKRAIHETKAKGESTRWWPGPRVKEPEAPGKSAGARD